MLTRLGGQPMAVNPDLIEKAEATPDTVVTLVDGHKFVVAESVPEVVDRVRAWRASVAAEAFRLSGPAPSEHGPDRGPERGSDRGMNPGDRLPGQRHVGTGHPAGTGRQAQVEAQAADGSVASPLARVLRLPAREE